MNISAGTGQNFAHDRPVISVLCPINSVSLTADLRNDREIINKM